MSRLLAAADAVARLLGAKDETRRSTADFGPPPAAVYARELASYSDEYLTFAEVDEILARAQAAAAARNLRKVSAR